MYINRLVRGDKMEILIILTILMCLIVLMKADQVMR